MIKLNFHETRARLQELTNQLLVEQRANQYPPKDEVEEVVSNFYRSFSDEKPHFVWLANPWQLMYAPAFFTGFNRRQIRIQDFQERTCKQFREVMIREMGADEFTSLFEALWQSFPELQLRIPSNLVETEIRILERDRVERTTDLCRRFEERLMNKVYRRNLCLETSVLSRIGNQISWFALEHYTGRTPPWSHMSSSHHLVFDDNLNWNGTVTPSPDAIPPGMEWSHFLRLQHALALFADRYLDLRPGEAQRQELAAFERLARSVHAIACFPEVCFLSEPPLSLVINNSRFHNPQGPAISYAEGFNIYCWNGVRVPERAIEGTPTLVSIENERNLEAMRVLIERYGFEKFLADSKAEKIQEDDRGALYRIATSLGEAITLLAVQNSTAESDGSFKRYFLRVPPEIATAHDAVAWTFSMEGADYSPIAES